MKANWLPIFLFVIIAFVIANETIDGYQKRKEAYKSFATYLAAERIFSYFRRG